MAARLLVHVVDRDSATILERERCSGFEETGLCLAALRDRLVGDSRNIQFRVFVGGVRVPNDVVERIWGVPVWLKDRVA